MLGDNIRRVRTKKGIGLNKLASMAGISAGYLSDLENNKVQNPTMEKLKSIADALGVSLDRLTGEAVSSIIEERLEVLGITKAELVEQAGIPKSLYWLENIDTYVPGELGGPNDIAYRWITKIAEVLDLPAGQLRAALARQEVPTSYAPQSTPEEDFAEPYEDEVRSDNSAKIRTIAAHLEGKDLTPQKMKLLEQYINTLFDEDK
jgi:transcriptional regulator with XRE-family HTH domain